MNNQQEIHPELQPDFTPEIPESHHLPIWVWVTVVAIIGLLAIGLVAYGAYQYLNSNNQDDCITLYEPVCGKDGKTYSNSCVADLDGAEVDYMGKCEADEFEDWQTYRNSEHGYELRFPSDLVLQENTGEAYGEAYTSFLSELEGRSYFLHFGYISQDTLNRIGISYCQAHPSDSRCENLSFNGSEFLIDWNIETEGAFTQSRSEILKSEGGMIMINIMHSPAQDIKSFFRQILSTFKFID